MGSFAISVVGHDRPGIIAGVTGALAEPGGNIEDSSMTLLRGHFAWMLIVKVDKTAEELDATVSPLRRPDLAISVLELPAESGDQVNDSVPYWLTVHGADRPGIVSAITGEIAAVGGNLTNLSTRLAGDLYVVGADVDLPQDVDAAALQVKLTTVADALGVTASLRAADSDLL